MPKTAPRLIVGWREWVAFPDLGGVRIKAKIDTGARTSALHAWDCRVIDNGGAPQVEFVLHPIQRRSVPAITCRAQLHDVRTIRSSNGSEEQRYVIKTPLRMGDRQWPVELTLTNRDAMGFRALIGRQALRRRALVDPSASFGLGGADQLGDYL